MTICTPWRVANALEQLLAQVNAFAPNRNKGSDGSIGDPAHQTELCASQHNSCCIKVGGIWIIRARDFTHDPAGGFDSYAFAEQLRLSRDPRIRYVISNHRITSASRNWQWETYAGSDPHTNHAHVSTWDDQARFDDTSRAWVIAPPPPPPPPPKKGVGMYWSATQVPVNTVDVLGTPVVNNTRMILTPKGPVALLYGEIIDLYTEQPKLFQPMSWPRLNLVANTFRPDPIDPVVLAQQIAANYPVDQINEQTILSAWASEAGHDQFLELFSQDEVKAILADEAEQGVKNL